jgi:hypothetical protein
MQGDPHHAADDADDPFSIRVLHAALAFIVIVVMALMLAAAVA